MRQNLTGFSFRFKQKLQAKPVEINQDPDDLFTKMTDAQRHLFAHKLSELSEVGSEYAKIGESSECFTKRLAEMLLQPEKFRELYPLLIRIGFTP